MPPWDESRMRYVGQWFTYAVFYDRNFRLSGPCDTYEGAAKRIDAEIKRLRFTKHTIQSATVTEKFNDAIIKVTEYYQARKRVKPHKPYEQLRLFSRDQLAGMRKRRML